MTTLPIPVLSNHTFLDISQWAENHTGIPANQVRYNKGYRKLCQLNKCTQSSNIRYKRINMHTGGICTKCLVWACEDCVKLNDTCTQVATLQHKKNADDFIGK